MQKQGFLFDEFLRDGLGNILQRQSGGGQRNAELFVDEHRQGRCRLFFHCRGRDKHVEGFLLIVIAGFDECLQGSCV